MLKVLDLCKKEKVDHLKLVQKFSWIILVHTEAVKRLRLMNKQMIFCKQDVEHLDKSESSGREIRCLMVTRTQVKSTSSEIHSFINFLLGIPDLAVFSEILRSRAFYKTQGQHLDRIVNQINLFFAKYPRGSLTDMELTPLELNDAYSHFQKIANHYNKIAIFSRDVEDVLIDLESILVPNLAIVSDKVAKFQIWSDIVSYMDSSPAKEKEDREKTIGSISTRISEFGNLRLTRVYKEAHHRVEIAKNLIQM